MSKRSRQYREGISSRELVDLPVELVEHEIDKTVRKPRQAVRPVQGVQPLVDNDLRIVALLRIFVRRDLKLIPKKSNRIIGAARLVQRFRAGRHPCIMWVDDLR